MLYKLVKVICVTQEAKYLKNHFWITPFEEHDVKSVILSLQTKSFKMKFCKAENIYFNELPQQQQQP